MSNVQLLRTLLIPTDKFGDPKIVKTAPSFFFNVHLRRVTIGLQQPPRLGAHCSRYGCLSLRPQVGKGYILVHDRLGPPPGQLPFPSSHFLKEYSLACHRYTFMTSDSSELDAYVP